jgi:signal transduction histidine kinase
MNFKNNPTFRPRARLLLQLGDQLIKNENIAVLELVKNSYDADARNVKIRMKNVENKEFGKIEILDDGCGMDEDVLKNAWLEPGSDYKELQFRKNKRSVKYNRLPIGEKGIGRFGVHKLGNKIELITRKEDALEYVVTIDWKEFAKKKYLKDAEISIIARPPQYFLRKRHGTRIIITDLKTDWDRRMVRDIYKALFTLSSPFKTIDHFSIDFEIDRQDWISDLISWKEVGDFALFYYKVKIHGSEIKEFYYRFKPWKSMDKLTLHEVDITNQFIIDHQTLEVTSQENKKEKVILDLRKYHIGDVDFEGYIFDRDLKLLDLIEENKVRQIRKYLDENGGIRVYRDNLRINEYGEKGNDWLNLDLRRVNVPAKRISNNIILSVINIKREDSSDLIEKTNREGFVENEAYNEFKAAILYVVGIIEKLRQVDKANLRDAYSPSENEEPVLHLTKELKQYVDKKIKDDTIRGQIIDYIDQIEKDYNEINEILLTASGAGLTLGVGIHEIDKLVKNLVAIVKVDSVSNDVRDLIQDLQTTVNDFLHLLKQNDKKSYSIKELIDSSLANLRYRLKVHNIEIIKAYSDFGVEIKIDCSRRFFLSSILNIIDNSIYWLEKKHRNFARVKTIFEKKIFINLYAEKNGSISLLIADNGTGFTLPTSQIIKPFITSKDEGMGLGLHITNQIMKVMDARMVFPESGDYNIPQEFNNGAIIILQFKER